MTVQELPPSMDLKRPDVEEATQMVRPSADMQTALTEVPGMGPLVGTVQLARLFVVR
jgi:hypothetical protein